MARFRLATVLRARLAQEDVAKAEVVRARGASRFARGVAREREGALRATDVPTGVAARAVVAALVARQSLAAGLAAAQHDIVRADEHADQRRDDLEEAAKRRRIVEKLGERHAAAQRAKIDAADQRAIDEIAVTAAARKGGALS